MIEGISGKRETIRMSLHHSAPEGLPTQLEDLSMLSVHVH